MHPPTNDSTDKYIKHYSQASSKLVIQVLSVKDHSFHHMIHASFDEKQKEEKRQKGTFVYDP